MGWGSGVAESSGVGRRSGSDPECRLVAVPLIQPLVCNFHYYHICLLTAFHLCWPILSFDNLSCKVSHGFLLGDKKATQVYALMSVHAV